MPQDETVTIRQSPPLPPTKVSDLAMFVADREYFMASGNGPLQPKAARYGQRWHRQLGAPKTKSPVPFLIWFIVLAVILAILLD